MGKICDIIKYEGDNSTFVWKHPDEDFNSLTQLIVHESQEAIFFMNGQALDLFGPGRYTLETQNIPVLGKMLNKATGGETPFHCEVYFINKTVQMAVKWGTDSWVRFVEPTMGLPLELGASGEMNLQVSDSRKLLTKLVGTMNGIAWGDRGGGFTKSLQSSFRPLINTAVKTHLSSSIKKQNIDILEIDENLEVLSHVLQENIRPGFEEYGLTIPQFYITNVILPDTETNKNLKPLRELHTIAMQTRMAEAEAQVRTAQAEAEAAIVAAKRKAEMERQTTETEVARQAAERELIKAQAEAQKTKMAGFAEAEVMRAQGYNQKDVIQAEVQKAYAEGLGNMGSNGGGGVASEFVGLGAGLAAMGAMSGQMGEMFKGMTGATTAPAAAAAATCAKCGAALPEGAKFCLECGEKVAPAVPAGSVVCPSCGTTVPQGKFCPECGHKFVTSCPKCGNQVPAGAKFCLECGEKL